MKLILKGLFAILLLVSLPALSMNKDKEESKWITLTDCVRGFIGGAAVYAANELLQPASLYKNKIEKRNFYLRSLVYAAQTANVLLDANKTLKPSIYGIARRLCLSPIGYCSAGVLSNL